MIQALPFVPEEVGGLPFHPLIVHAVVVLKASETVDAETLIAHCKTLIAGYKCPRSVEQVDALPISGAGKVLKMNLRKPWWEGRERAVA